MAGSKSLGAAAKALASWYSAHARNLPWRRNVSPYRVLVSEIMLQQTTVETVAPYFERFTAALPTVRALAKSKVDRVLALWSGLGYYRRARSLHAAARVIVSEHRGRVPRDAEQLLRLPGIGPYTAAAILSIAYARPVLALDGNLKRVLARLIAYEGDISRKAGERALLVAGESLLHGRSPSAINQALMDVGALLCTPRAPQCHRCPLAHHCEARGRGSAESIPGPARRPAQVTVTLAAAVVRDRGRVLLRRRAGPLMEGLWEFPMAEAGAEPDLERRISEELAMTHGALGGLRRIATLRHNITRHRIRIVVFEAFLRGDAAARSSSARSLDRARPARWRRSGKSAAADSAATDLAGTLSTGRGRWIVSHQLASLPLTGIARKIVRACAGLGTEEGESAPAPEDAITRVMRGGEA